MVLGDGWIFAVRVTRNRNETTPSRVVVVFPLVLGCCTCMRQLAYVTRRPVVTMANMLHGLILDGWLVLEYHSESVRLPDNRVSQRL